MTQRQFQLRKSTTGNRLEVVKSGAPYFDALLALLASARHEIQFQCYIFKGDITGKSVKIELIKAAQRGVKVCLLLDAFGSAGMPTEMLVDFEKAGVEVRFFGRFFSKGRFHLGRRLHHKIVAVDGIRALVGGINVSDDYNAVGQNGPWLDYAIKIAGRSARKLQLVCRHYWLRTQYRHTRRRLRMPGLKAVPVVDDTAQVAIAQNDYLRGKNEIAKSYRQAIRSASHSVDLIGAYFLPGRTVRQLIRSARERGVRVRLVMAGKSDVKLAAYAREYLYAWLLRHGVEIHEYLPGNVHGKLLLADGELTSIGSFDLNNLSTYSNIELNLNILDKDFGQKIKDEFERVISTDCRRITQKEHVQRFSWWKKLLCWCSYRITKSFFVLSWIVAGPLKKARQSS